MARIGLMTIGLGGHIGPAIRLGAVLVRHGHEVIAWAPERHRPHVQLAGMRFQAHEPWSERRPWRSLVGFAAVLARVTECDLGQLVEQLFDRDVDLIIHDCHAPWGRAAADFLGLPRVVSDPLFPFRDDFVFTSDSWKAAPGSGAPWIGSVDPEHVSGALTEIEVSRASVGRRWGVEMGGWQDILHSRGPATVSFTTERILGAEPPDPSWRCVGPLMDTSPARNVAVIGPPLVYVAFGTFFSVRPEPFRAVVEGLAGEPFDVLVSTGGAGLTAADLGPLPGNVEVHPFVDSRQVLARAQVHVTHGGGSSIHESLLAGVPMVCLPLGSDQPAWSSRVEQLGAGKIVEPRPEAIQVAVRQMLTDEPYHSRAAELGRHLACFDGEARVAELIATVLSGLESRLSASG